MLKVIWIMLMLIGDPVGAKQPAEKPDAHTQLDPGIAERELALGQLAYRESRFKEAVNHFDEALKHGADEAETLYWRGLAHFRLGNHEKAEGDLMAASSEFSDDIPLRLALGRAQMAQGKFMWAMRQFMFVTEERPEDVEALLDLAYSLMRMHAFTEATEVLENAIKIAPEGDLRDRAGLLLGICHYRAENMSDARGLLFGIRKGRLARGAGQVLERILEMEASIEKGWRAYFTAGAGVDSNPVMGDEPIPGLSRSEDAALDFMLAAGLHWTPFVRGAHSLAGRIDLGRHFYVAPWDLEEAHKNVEAFSMTTVSAGGDYTFAYLRPRGVRKLKVGYNFRLVQLDGGDGLPGEDKPFIFSESHGLSLNWSMQNRADRTFDLQLRPFYSAYRDNDRDGAGVMGKARWSLFFREGRLKLFPELTLGYTDAQFDGWKHLTAGGWLGMSWLGPWNLDFSGYLSQEARIHPASKNAFGVGANPWNLDSDVYRQDHVTTLAAGVGRRLDEKGRWRMDLHTRYMRSWSTAKFFQYSRITAMLSVTAMIGDNK